MKQNRTDAVGRQSGNHGTIYSLSLLGSVQAFNSAKVITPLERLIVPPAFLSSHSVSSTALLERCSGLSLSNLRLYLHMRHVLEAKQGLLPPVVSELT